MPVELKKSRSIPLDTEKLIQWYAIENLPSTEIAKRFGITFPTVIRRLRELGITIKPKYGNPYNKNRVIQSNIPDIITDMKIIKQKQTGLIKCPSCNKSRRLYLNKKRIEEIINNDGKCFSCLMKARALPLSTDNINTLYNTNHLSTNEIASLLNVSPHTIIRNLRNQSAQIRTKEETRHLSFLSHHPCNGTIENPIISDVRNGTELGLKNNSYYVWVECTKCKALRWETKSRVSKLPLCKPCAMKLCGENHRGENASAWLGGISFEPYTYEFNERLKEQIRKRDNYTCQLCGNKQNGHKLAVHHIDYNKKNSHPNNLISLCHKNCPQGCHSKTNHNRGYWKEYFTNLMTKQNKLMPIKNPPFVWQR